MESSQLGAYDQPLDVDVLEGEVVLRSAAGALSVALTPSAALETARRLERAAEQAGSQASQAARSAASSSARM